MDENLKNWLEFYYGTTDVPPSKITDSLSGYHFYRYPRNKAEESRNKRIYEFAKSQGLKVEEGSNLLSTDDGTRLNKRLSDMYNKARVSAWETNEKEALEVASPKRGLDMVDLQSRPVFIYGGAKEDVTSDGFMLLKGHGSRESLTDFIRKDTIKSLKKLGAGKDEIEKSVNNQIAGATNFPKYENLFPKKEEYTNELKVIGVGFNDQSSAFNVYLTDGKDVVAVNADKFAWLRERLPHAKLYGRLFIKREIKHDKDGNLVKDDKGDLVWDEEKSDQLDVTGPVSFVEDDKPVGLLMPMSIGGSYGKNVTLADSKVPDVIKQAVALKQNTRELYDKNKYDYLQREGETTLQSIESSRSLLSQSSDERQEHSLILDADDPRVEKWKRDPGMADVRGIDTPKKGKKKVSKRRSSKPATTMKRMRK